MKNIDNPNVSVNIMVWEMGSSWPASTTTGNSFDITSCCTYSADGNLEVNSEAGTLIQSYIDGVIAERKKHLSKYEDIMKYDFEKLALIKSKWWYKLFVR